MAAQDLEGLIEQDTAMEEALGLNKYDDNRIISEFVEEAIKEAGFEDERAREQELVNEMLNLMRSERSSDQELVDELNEIFEHGTPLKFMRAVKGVHNEITNSSLYSPMVPSNDFANSKIGNLVEARLKGAQKLAANRVDKGEAHKVIADKKVMANTVQKWQYQEQEQDDKQDQDQDQDQNQAAL